MSRELSSQNKKGNWNDSIQSRVNEIADHYKEDQIPWVVGYSGGKDSTVALQLVWLALQQVKPKYRTKPVHVISTDTLVENPVVSAWVSNSLDKINETARSQNLPVQSHRLTPSLNDSFWVNLIGRGYAAPRQKFRWCTARLKINPSNKFISTVVSEYGEVLLILGTRKAESRARAKNMSQYENSKLPERINPSGSLQNSYIYTPIEDWSNDDVWSFLIENQNPWGHDNYELFNLYKGATEGGECPLVVEQGTPSCGDSRFGCWVCTLVEKDKSMQAMIQNNEDRKWMTPLLELRNEFDFRSMSSENGDRHLRDHRRMNGQIQIYNNRPIPGPYKAEFRHYLLRRLLEVEILVQESGPDYVKDLKLIQTSELSEIRRIWVADKHEIEDALPRIYEEVTGEAYSNEQIIEGLPFGLNDMNILRNLCENDESLYELLREAIMLEIKNMPAIKRRGIFKSLSQTVERNLYKDKEKAIEHAKDFQEQLNRVRKVTDDI